MIDTDTLLETVRHGLMDKLGACEQLEWAGRVAGGDINQAALVTDGTKRWFLKFHHNAPDGMFAAEACALDEIGEQACIRVPRPVAYGSCHRVDWLVMEHLELRANGREDLLGEQLADLHRVTATQHGWNRDNYIGSTPQDNKRQQDWAGFWHDRRLKPQLELARSAGHDNRLIDTGEKLLENLHHLLQGYRPAPSLLHGDLWSGNKAFTADGRPVIFDPASYYGDRETDIAMTGLFGGFGPDFYAAYQSAYPLDDGFELRRELYNLYHLLNHLNLFGSGYLSRCQDIIEGMLAQVR